MARLHCPALDPLLRKHTLLSNELHTINYHPQRSWGKVIFSEACVKNSVHGGGGGGGMRGKGVCVGRGVCMHGRGRHAWQGTCIAGGHAWKREHAWWWVCIAGGCVWQEGIHGRGACMAWGRGHAWHTVNEWAVRILLECILVLFLFLTFEVVKLSL